jgi:hypothetical protein
MAVYVERLPQTQTAEAFSVPPLYVFLPMFVALVYWLVCVHRLHVVLKEVPGWKHPISPARAVGFHFLPVYSLYWLYKWPRELAKFVNWRLQRPALKPEKAGLFVFFAYVSCIVLGPGGMLLLFLCIAYLKEWMRRALSSPPVPGSFPPAT